MIVRPFTFLTGLLFALSGAYLFVVKHQSESLQDQHEQYAEAARQDEQSIRVLQAQWALEADPSRIAALAAQFTGLQPMKPGQLVTMASLASSLPPPGSAAPFSNPQDQIPAMPGAGAAPATPSGPPIEVQGHVASATQAGKPVAGTSAPTQMAANAAPQVLRPAKPHPAKAENRIASASNTANMAANTARKPARSETHLASARPATGSSALYETPEQRAALPKASAPQAPVVQTSAHGSGTVPMGAQVMRVRADAAPAPQPAPAAPAEGGSLLGMAQTGSQN